MVSLAKTIILFHPSRDPERSHLSRKREKIWETHECEKFWFGYDVTFFPPDRPSVRNPTMLKRPWRDAFTTEMLKNTKYEVNLHVFVAICWQTWKEEKEREKKNRKAETLKRATDSKLEQAGRKSKF